jgi:hypothetical protein
MVFDPEVTAACARTYARATGASTVQTRRRQASRPTARRETDSPRRPVEEHPRPGDPGGCSAAILPDPPHLATTFFGVPPTIWRAAPSLLPCPHDDHTRPVASRPQLRGISREWSLTLPGIRVHAVHPSRPFAVHRSSGTTVGRMPEGRSAPKW